MCFSPAKSSSPPETSPCLPWAYRLQTELKKRCISAGFASKIKTQIMKQTVSHHKLTAWKAYFKRKSTHFSFYTHASHVNRTSGELMACLLKRPITSASFVLHRGKSKQAAPMCVTPVKAKSKRDQGTELEAASAHLGISRSPQAARSHSTGGAILLLALPV